LDLTETIELDTPDYDLPIGEGNPSPQKDSKISIATREKNGLLTYQCKRPTKLPSAFMDQNVKIYNSSGHVRRGSQKSRNRDKSSSRHLLDKKSRDPISIIEETSPPTEANPDSYAHLDQWRPKRILL
jgi:hypothetical protein